MNGSKAARRGATMLKLTRSFFAALRQHALEPLVAQRVVTNGVIGTAVDVICQRGKDEIVVMELKCGFAGDRDAAALVSGKPQTMAFPCAKARDSFFNRHMAQLAVGMHLLLQESATLKSLQARGIQKVTGMLVYVNNDTVSFYELSQYWQKRAAQIVETLLVN